MPVVTLKMGPTLNPDGIKEGDGVYFECTVRSNPKPYKMAWYHNVSKSNFLLVFYSLLLRFVIFLTNNQS